MKRPLALIGLTLIVVLAVCFYLGNTASLVMIILAVLGIAVSLFIKKLRKVKTFTVFFSVVFIGVTLFSVYTDFHVQPIVQKYSGKEHSIVATIDDEGVYENGVYFYSVTGELIDNEKADVKISLCSEEAIVCETGDKISFKSMVNKGNYSGSLADREYLSVNIYENEEIEIIPSDSWNLYGEIVSLRDKLRSALYLELDYDNAAFASAILLGDDSGFSDETVISLRRAGLTHIVVVSGLHLSIITMLYNRFFGKFIRNKYINSVITVFIVLFFLCLTGFGKSSIRAAIMLFVLIAGRVFNRISDSVNSLGLAALILCVPNPYIVGDIGVLLSFSATFGITAFGMRCEKFLKEKLCIKDPQKRITKAINKVIRYFIALFSCSFTAILATLPIVLVFFGKVSLVQLISNLIVLPTIQFFIILTVLCLCFHFIPFLGMVGDIVAFVTDMLGRFILGTADVMASLPFAYISAGYKFVVVWVIVYVLIFAVAYNIRKHGKGLNIICLAVSFSLLVFGMAGHTVLSSNTLSLHIFPSYNGYGILLSKESGNILISCTKDKFTYSRINQTLEGMYSHNQLMVVSSSDNNAEDKAEIILDKFDYDRVLVYDNDVGFMDINSESTLNKTDKPITTFSENHWGCVDLYMLCVDESVYTYFCYGDQDVLCLPSSGDINTIPSQWLSPDILVTTGLVDNMDKLEFETLVVNGKSLDKSSVIDYFSDRKFETHTVDDTIILDIAG